MYTNVPWRDYAMLQTSRGNRVNKIIRHRVRVGAKSVGISACEGFTASLLRDLVTRVTGKLRTTLELEAAVEDINSCLTNAFRVNCSLG